MSPPEPPKSPPAPAANTRPGTRLIALSALFVLAVACAGYWWTGQPAAISGSPHGPAAAANAEEAAKVAEFSGMVEKLRERMDKEPVAEGLAMLGRSYLVLGQPDQAIDAYQRSLKMQPQNASVLADMADAMGVKNNGSLIGAPMALIEQALRVDPDNLKALMLAGSEAFDRQDYALALKRWQRMVTVGPAEHPLVQQAAAAVQEAQQRLTAGSAGGGVAAPATAAAPSTASAPRTGEAPKAAGSASVSGHVSLAAALKAQAGPEDTVFIFARAAEGPRVPLAILRRQVKDLPLAFTLDDSLAMSPAARLSSASQVIVGARISKSGNAMPQPGDLEVLSDPVAVGTQGLKLEISKTVR